METCLKLLAAVVAVSLIGSSCAQTEGDFRYELYNLTNPLYLDSDEGYTIVTAPQGIPIGPTRKENIVVVWRNGLVTFGFDSASADLKTPTKFSTAGAEFLLAPLWFPNINPDLIYTEVSWQQHQRSNDDSDFILQFASDSVRDFSVEYFGELTEFTPTWALVVDWVVNVYPEDTDDICMAYYECQCGDQEKRQAEDGSSEDPFEEGSAGSAACDPSLCMMEYGMSEIEALFLSLLCQQTDYNYNYRINELGEGGFPGVRFQLVLATDGEDSHAVFLYECNSVHYYYLSVFDILYNHTAIGYRLGPSYQNNTCPVPDLYRCSRNPATCANRFVPPSYADFAVSAIFYNLTDAFSRFQFTDPLDEGTDFIKFQMPGLMASEVPYVSLTRQLDGASAPILHSGIGIGTTIQTNLYVGTNGIVSFGRPFYFWYSQSFPTRYPWIRDTYVAAPFWHDVDIRNIRGGNVSYSVLTAKDPGQGTLFTTVNTFIQYQTDNTEFEADWLLVSYWDEVRVYPHYNVERSPQYYSEAFRDTVLNDYNTFEAIIASSGGDTYAIYTYDCRYLMNPGAYSKAVIGFNLGGLQFMNDPFSESFVANRIACRHYNSSNWYNLVYKLNTGENEILQAQKRCRSLVAEDVAEFSNEDISDVKKQLNPCPCTIRNAWRDRNYRSDQDDFYCFYRRFPVQGLTQNFDQYCCYDTNFNDGTWGALVKTGYRVSGMAWLYDRGSGRSLRTRDSTMRRVCCGLAGLCELYLDRRPPNDCTGYEPPVWTWAWGDPHITTLDGYSYTFNGYGEYTLLNLQRNGTELEFQGRMRPTPNTAATEFSAFAIGYRNASFVEIDCSSPSPFCKILFGGNDISLNLTNIKDTYTGGADPIQVIRESETTVSVVFGLGVTLAVNYSNTNRIPNFQLTLDRNLRNGSTIQGLLGNNDKDSLNDLFSRSRLELDPNTATERNVFDNGNTWLTEFSFFTYEDGMSTDDFRNALWTPSFTADVLEMASQEVKDRCTPPGAAEPLEQCVFDAVETGDVNVGVATLDTLNENNLAMAESTNMPPMLTGEPYLRVGLYETVYYNISVRDDNDEVTLQLNNAPPGSSIWPTIPGEYIFSWDLESLVEGEEILPLVFHATDSLGAVGTFSPHLRICACENNGNCTMDGLANPDAEVVVANCICPPAWEGRYCQRDVDGCLEYACLEGVECIDVPAPGEGAECGPCPVGYTGDGLKCADVDECARNLTDCQQVCTNTEGSSECSCWPGYRVNPSWPSACDDIDECSLRLSGCDQVCNNTAGSFICECEEGFTLENDGRTCTPDDFCADPAVCGDAECAMINGQDQCFCRGGYWLNSTGTGCNDIDECTLSYCSSLCVNLPGSYVCSCSSGYELGPDRTTCLDIDECLVASMRGQRLCEDGYQCVNYAGWYDCTCPPGQYLISVKEDDEERIKCGSREVRDDFSDHGITLTLESLNEDQVLAPGRIDDLSVILVDGVKEYCAGGQCRIEDGDMADTTRRRRAGHITFYDPDEDSVQAVFDLGNVVGGDEGVSVPFYIEVDKDGEIGVLNANDTLAATQASVPAIASEFSTSVAVSLTNPPITTSPPSTEEEDDEEDLDIPLVAGVAAGAAVAAVILVVLLAAILYICVLRNSMSKSTSDKRALLHESVSWPDGKPGGSSEMKEVPPPFKMTEDPGKTVIVNTEVA